MIMEGDKSQDLWWVRWSPRRDEGVVPAWRVVGSRLGKSYCFSSSSLETGKKIDTLNSKALIQKKCPLPMGGSAFLFSSFLQLIWWCPLTLERAISSPQSTDLRVISSRNTPITTTRMTDQMSGYLIAQSRWHKSNNQNAQWLKTESFYTKVRNKVVHFHHFYST